MTQTYSQLQQQIESLKTKAAQLKQSELQEVVAKIRVAIDAYGISQQDLFGSGAKRASEKRGPARRIQSKAKGAGFAKYSDGSGNTWVGLGKRPRWLHEALAGGRKLEEFLSGDVASAATASSANRSTAKSSGKARTGSKAPYRDDAGNTWGGRGPRPRWLKDALAAGKSLEDLGG